MNLVSLFSPFYLVLKVIPFKSALYSDRMKLIRFTEIGHKTHHVDSGFSVALVVTGLVVIHYLYKKE